MSKITLSRLTTNRQANITMEPDCKITDNKNNSFATQQFFIEGKFDILEANVQLV